MDKPHLADRMLDDCDFRDRRAWRWPMLSLVILSGGLLLWTPGETLASDDLEDKGAQLREEAREVVSRYAKEFDEYIKALRQSKTREQRDQAEEKRPKPVSGAARLVSWAERNPKDPIAVDLLVTVVRHGRFTTDAQMAANILSRDHLDLDAARFADATFQVMLWPMPVAEKWLGAYLDKSPDRQTRA